MPIEGFPSMDFNFCQIYTSKSVVPIYCDQTISIVVYRTVRLIESGRKCKKQPIFILETQKSIPPDTRWTLYKMMKFWNSIQSTNKSSI